MAVDSFVNVLRLKIEIEKFAKGCSPAGACGQRYSSVFKGMRCRQARVARGTVVCSKVCDGTLEVGRDGDKIKKMDALRSSSGVLLPLGATAD